MHPVCILPSHCLFNYIHLEQISLTNALNVSMCELPMFDGLDELVADMVVDPDAARAQSEHAQRVLVIVGQRAVADCVKTEEKLKETKE